MDFHGLLKKALLTTLNHPILWLLGLFLAGGFNANFFYWPSLSRHQFVFRLSQWELWREPEIIIGAILLLAVGIVLANWAKTIFIVHGATLLDLPRIERNKDQSAQNKDFSIAVKDSWHYLSRVIGMSLFTVAISVIVTIAFAYPLWRVPLLQNSVGFVVLTVGLFLAITIIISCLNIFAAFFIVLYDYPANTGLGAAKDLLRTKWVTILNFLLILMLLYVIGLFIGGAMVRAGAELTFIIGQMLFPFSISVGSAIMQAAGVIGALLFWIWLGVMHAFFNLSLLILFSELLVPLSQVEPQQTLQVADS